MPFLAFFHYMTITISWQFWRYLNKLLKYEQIFIKICKILPFLLWSLTIQIIKSNFLKLWNDKNFIIIILIHGAFFESWLILPDRCARKKTTSFTWDGKTRHQKNHKAHTWDYKRRQKRPPTVVNTVVTSKRHTPW